MDTVLLGRFRRYFVMLFMEGNGGELKLGKSASNAQTPAQALTRMIMSSLLHKLSC